MKKIAIALATASLVFGLSACAIPSEPLPQAAPPAAGAPSETPVEQPVVEEAPKATSCDIAREAILTGTPAGITKAMKGLVADKTADATAREYARYYTGRDKSDKDMREMDIGIIQMSCS